MTCPPISAHYILIEWVFNIAQVVLWIAIWEATKIIWRALKPIDNSNGRGIVQGTMKHVVIAMNHLMGLSFVRHHHLPPERTTIVCDAEEVSTRLRGIDIHDLAIHVAGDMRSIAHDTEVFQAILWLTTHH